ncbi:single-stranded DNA-binding protein [Microbacterium sp. ARD31]|uniref:single-stranded DNA-binding protein n=1 Tax=Microbacterium sp. ARD31 TaxID=2962576 RepID=UPI002881877A|nr:single-stranded DNA-binding protein [Microbacterium sp. ARD31]MDT0184583.1 single-stranded DNA-binding protein [Microbacterium sp. ARD31]
MNDTQITLTGWIGGPVTLRDLGDGRQVASFRLACTPSRFRDGEWVKGTTTWHTVKAWNRLAGHVAQSLASGEPVVVHGRLVADVWERDGRPQTSFEVVASAVGHDLTHGTTVLTRPVRAEVPSEAPTEAPTEVRDPVPVEASVPSGAEAA